MSDERNPFAAGERPTGLWSRLSIASWCIAFVACGGAVVCWLMLAQTKAAHAKESATLRSELERANRNLAEALSVTETNQDILAFLTNQIKDLEQQKEAAGQMARSLEDEMRQELESKDVKISKLQGKLTVTIVDRVMFDSGEAVLKPDGAAVIDKIAALLTSHPELRIHVAGHTDNVPIRPTAQSKFAGNWELSVARALAAVHHLTERAGIDPRRVGAVGYGEFRPIADNASADGRAKNRRIEIVILPEELAPPDERAQSST